jgi:hypothetical protein
MGLSSSECLLEISGTMPPAREDVALGSGDAEGAVGFGTSSSLLSSFDLRFGFLRIPLSALTADCLTVSSGN